MYLSGLDAEAVEYALAQEGWPPDVRRVLELRQLTGSASVKKLFAMENQASGDDRLRNLIVHHGARTGRPTGEGPQPLNLPRSGPKLVWCGSCRRPHKDVPLCPWCGALGSPGRKGLWTPDMAPFVLEIMAMRSLPLVERFFGDALLAISGCLRSLFVSAPGHDLIASDYSAIEAVVTAMLSGEQWRIEAFQRNDPIYLVGASKITGTPVSQYLQYYEAHGEHHPDRQDIGKVSELACFTRATQVLTTRGYVNITDVRAEDSLWDGVEWVRHAGVVAKGIAGTVRLDGVEMTPNHLINLSGSWREARRLASNPFTLCRALASASVSLPWRSPTTRGLRIEKFSSFALAATGLMRSHFRTFVKGRARAARRALGKRPARIVSAFSDMLTLCPTKGIVADSLTGFPPVSPVAGRTAMPTMVLEGFGSTSRGETERKGAAPSSPMSCRLTDGTSRNWNWTASTLTAITRRAISALLPKRRTPGTNGRFRKCNRESTDSKPVYDIAYAGPRNRFTIKTNSGHLLVHNCGFGGWINSYKAFGSTEADDVIKQQILAWRAASPAIVEFWGGQWRGPPWRREYAELFGVEGAAIWAVQNPDCPRDFRGLTFLYDPTRDALTIRLLSGRPLTYHAPRLAQSQRNADEWALSYMTWNSNPKYGPMGWVRMSTFGGRLTENIVQAVAHDILRYAILALRAARYPTVLHVYDEIVVEVPEGFGSLEEVEAIMSTMPVWAHGWPVRACGGWRGKRYRKG